MFHGVSGPEFLGSVDFSLPIVCQSQMQDTSLSEMSLSSHVRFKPANNVPILR